MFIIEPIASTPPVTKAALKKAMVMEYPKPKSLSFGLAMLDPKYRLADDFDSATMRMAEDKCSKTYAARQGAHLESVARMVIEANPKLRVLQDPLMGADVSFIRGREIFVVDFKNSFSTVNDSSARGCYEKLKKTAFHFQAKHKKPIITALLTSVELKRKSYQSHYGLNFVDTRDTMCIIGNNYNFYNVWLEAVSGMVSNNDQYNKVVGEVADDIRKRLAPYRTSNGFNHGLAIQRGM